ncbi:hypothetical protein KEM56_000242, partial [Ascosphaera pollenicola]
EAVFESYSLSSAAGVINLEVPLSAFNKALRSAINSASAQIRLTKKGKTPFLAFTIVTSSWTAPRNALGVTVKEEGTGSAAHAVTNPASGGANGTTVPTELSTAAAAAAATTSAYTQSGPRERESVVTQEVPVRVLEPNSVKDLHEPRCKEADVHIILPSLIQLKSISERFTKLALDTAVGAAGNGKAGFSAAASLKGPKLEISANMHGSMKLAIASDALRISSVWTGLINPEIDLGGLSQEALENLPSELMRRRGAEDADSEDSWAKVKVDGRDWGRVLSVGRLGPRVVASFINNTALVLYVYLRGTNDACLTYYINSYVN